ncbi:MAG: RNA polymerase sigma factor [Halomonadaceae bacterium]|nr:MAG: RNA polymerase sigma factor [Halomonadaceae bacterium]
MLDRFRARRFDRLVRPHLRSLYRFAYRLTGNASDAEDLVQEVMVKLLPRTPELEAVDNLLPWMNRVLYRLFLDHKRNIGRRPEGALTLVTEDGDPGNGLDQFTADALGPLGEMENDRLEALVRSVLDELPEAQRTLLVMHDWEGWAQEDLANLMEVSNGTIRSRLHRYRQVLRQALIKKLEQ